MNRLSSFSNEGLTFDVRDEGPRGGPVVIALHGFPHTAQSWSAVIPPLVAAGCRVLAPNQRGYSPGARPKGRKHYVPDRLAGDVVALADQAGAARFDVLGHDWGAVVAWQTAAAHPERVRTLTALSVPHLRAFLASMLRGPQLLYSWYMYVFQIPWLPERLLGSERAWPRVVKLLGATEAALPDIKAVLGEPAAARAALNWYRAMLHPAWLPSVPGKVAVPTLFVWGDGDALITAKAAELCRSQVSGPYRFETLRGVSHWIPDERPEDVARLLLAHLAEHASAPLKP